MQRRANSPMRTFFELCTIAWVACLATLLAGGKVEGSLVLPKEPPIGCTLKLVALDVGERAATSIELAAGAGDFRFDDVAPGAWRFELRAGGVDPLIVVDRVVVAAGAATVDPRLREVRVDRLCRPARIEVLDRNGGALRDAQVLAVAKDAASTAAPIPQPTIEGGRALVWIGGDGVTIEARAPGYRSRRVERVRGDARVTLDPSPRAVFVCAGDMPLGARDAKLGLKFWPLGVSKEEELAQTRQGVFGADRKLAFPIDRAGYYRARWVLIDAHGAATSGYEVFQRLQITDDPRVREHEFVIDAASVERALR